MSRIRPVVKWVGGKTKIMKEIVGGAPTEYNNYFEPFLGGGSVFLNMPFTKKAIINDTNRDVINIYKKIKQDPRKLALKLSRLEKAYNVLGNDRDKQNDLYKLNKRRLNKIKVYNFQRAALYIFINKTCFNGIMYENSRGEITATTGFHKKVKLYDLKNFLLLSKKLKKVTIKNTDYEKAVANIQSGDFLYLDPPYVPDDGTKWDRKYGKKNTAWKEADHERFFRFVDKMTLRGVKILMSNSDSAKIRKRYKKNKFYKYKRIPIKRTVAGKGYARGIKYEALISNY